MIPEDIIIIFIFYLFRNIYSKHVCRSVFPPFKKMKWN